MLALAAGAEDLLKNPGFEVVSGGAPADWSVFVQPKDGASSFLDQRVAKEGSNSVKLSIATSYVEDPANNWSQNVLADVRGKRLHLKGYIKTDNATEAAIWVQCYSKATLKLIRQESTSAKGLLTGTVDWTPVEATIDAPLDTDFVVVRCVLRFRGMAWFDALSLEAEQQSGAAALPGQAAPAPASAVTAMPTLPSMPTLPHITPSAPSPSTSALTAAPNDIAQAQDELRKMNWQLRQSNAELMKQLEELRKQIEDLKRQASDTAAAAKQLKEEQSKPVERDKPAEVPSPPLVPDEKAP